jgi:lysophospholipase L1-like esterase
MSPKRTIGFTALAAAAFALAACTAPGTQQGAETPQASSSEPEPEPASVVLVTIGDSIPNNASFDCPECTGFVESFGEALGDARGQPVTVENRSRHDGATAQDIADQLTEDDSLLELLPTADVILASFGFNDQPPYLSTGAPCQTATESSSDEEVFQALVLTTTECVDTATGTLRTTAAEILGRVRELAPDASLGVLNSYNSWIGWPRLEELAELKAPIAQRTAYALNAWNEALCAEATAVDAVCVDVYHRFNGPDGLAPAGPLLAADYTHPSQEGNDLIRDALVDSGLLD